MSPGKLAPRIPSYPAILPRDSSAAAIPAHLCNGASTSVEPVNDAFVAKSRGPTRAQLDVYSRHRNAKKRAKKEEERAKRVEEKRRQDEEAASLERTRQAALAAAEEQGRFLEIDAEAERQAETERRHAELRRRQEERELQRMEHERQQREKEAEARHQNEDDRFTAEALKAMRPRGLDEEWEAREREIREVGRQSDRRDLAKLIREAGSLHRAQTDAALKEVEVERSKRQKEPSRDKPRRSGRSRRVTQTTQSEE